MAKPCKPPKPRYARREDALRFLADSLREPPGSKLRELYKDAAQTLLWFAQRHERMGVRDNRSGRPKGTTGPRIDDRLALAVMAQIAAETGEVRPFTLARRAVESGVKLNGVSTKQSVIHRLALAYANLLRNN